MHVINDSCKYEFYYILDDKNIYNGSSILGASTLLDVLIQHLPLQSLF